MGTPDASTGLVPSYAAKLVYGIRQCTSPALLLFRMPDEYTEANCQEIDGVLQVDPRIRGVICDGTTDHEIPWLGEVDPANSNVTKPVWLRIIVRNNPNLDFPGITGEVLWKDGETWRHCITDEWIDSEENAIFTKGRWGASVHDKYYFINVFRAGDTGSLP